MRGKWFDIDSHEGAFFEIDARAADDFANAFAEVGFVADEHQ